MGIPFNFWCGIQPVHRIILLTPSYMLLLLLPCSCTRIIHTSPSSLSTIVHIRAIPSHCNIHFVFRRLAHDFPLLSPLLIAGTLTSTPSFLTVTISTSSPVLLPSFLPSSVDLKSFPPPAPLIKSIKLSSCSFASPSPSVAMWLWRSLARPVTPSAHGSRTTSGHG